MTEADPLATLVPVGCEALGIPLDPAWTPEVRQQLAVVLRHAALVGAFPLPDEAEPEPVFQA